MKQFKMLSIDGGGIKGLYSAKILNNFEMELRRVNGDSTRIVDYVDLICGTSTGGLIALALALRIPMETIKAFDHLFLLSVASLNPFPGKPPLLNRHRSFLRWALDLFNLSLIAQSEFADLFLKNAQQLQMLPMTYLRIPSATISRSQTPFIKLDLATPESFALMKQCADSIYHEFRMKPEIQSFFTERKTYQIKDFPI